jgi:hypothetical protein
MKQLKCKIGMNKKYREFQKNNETLLLISISPSRKGSSWFNSKSLVSGTMEFRLNLAPPK